MSKFSEHPLVQFPAFRAFYVGNVLVSAAARSITIILCWWLISREGEGAKGLSLLMMMQALPILAFSIFYGPLIDRFDRRLCMLFGASAQLVFSIVLWGFFYSGVGSFAALCTLVFVLSIFIPLVDDSSSAALETLVDAQNLTAASAVQSTVFELANVLAAVPSTALMSHFSVQAALTLTVVMYVVGVLFLSRMGTGEAPPKRLDKGDYWAELKEGFSYIYRTPALFPFVCVYFLVVFFLQQTYILIPLIVKFLLKADVGWVGALETSFSVGMVSTAFLLSTQTRHLNVYVKYAIAVGMTGLCFLAAGEAPSPYLTALAVLVLGVFFARFWSFASMIYQKVVPEEIKGRFFSVISTAMGGVAPLSYTAAGLISDAASPRATMLFDGAGLILLALVASRIPRLVEHLTDEETPA